jgi:hypothetical protein
VTLLAGDEVWDDDDGGGDGGDEGGSGTHPATPLQTPSAGDPGGASGSGGHDLTPHSQSSRFDYNDDDYVPGTAVRLPPSTLREVSRAPSPPASDSETLTASIREALDKAEHGLRASIVATNSMKALAASRASAAGKEVVVALGAGATPPAVQSTSGYAATRSIGGAGKHPASPNLSVARAAAPGPEAALASLVAQDADPEAQAGPHHPYCLLTAYRCIPTPQHVTPRPSLSF